MPDIYTSLPPPLADWVAPQAESMGLPTPDDYILLLLRLEKQNQEQELIPEHYRRVFHADRAAAPPLLATRLPGYADS